MKNPFIFGLFILLALGIVACNTGNPEPEITCPEPVSARFLGRDSILEGNYRGIFIGTPSDEVYTLLEDYRQKKMVTYQGAINNYFSDVTDLKNRIPLFDWLVLDEKTDTGSGVQLQLGSGRVKSITLNNRTELKQWPETAAPGEAVQLEDDADVLYNKLVAISKQPVFQRKFERIVLTARYTYAIYDPEKAKLPWDFVYRETPLDTTEQVRIFFKDKKVDYVIVDHFERQ
jgi:hypothetical protein